MPSAVDVTGKRYGRLVVIGPFRVVKKKRQWLCRCDCGVEKYVALFSLRCGRTISCGCRLREINSNGQATHGHTRGGKFSPEYRTWTAILQRCLSERNVSYPEYGGRGITVCERWRRSFESFLEDMGPKPFGMQIDRIDTNGHYEPGNCRWVSPRENNLNRRNIRWIDFDGRRQTMSDWAAEVGISAGAMSHRIARSDWTLEQALTTPRLSRRGAA